MYLVTGAKSGLGRYLQEEMKAIGFTRENKLADIQQRMEKPLEAIIHCAFNINRDITSSHFQSYINDNLLLTQQLLTIPHKKFIFISSADIYPKKRDIVWQEEDDFPIDEIENLYGLSKLMAEMLIKNQSSNYLILRPTALLGIYSRPNSLIKLLKGTENTFTLHANSSFNYILHQDVLQFIHEALLKDICGTFNLAASTSLLLEEVSTRFKRKVQFGSYTYQTATLCNKKVLDYCDVFANSSLDNIIRFHSTLMG